MGFKIKNVITKDVKIEIDDLTVLVGPNNSGKSRTLLDIHELFVKGTRTTKVLIKNIEFEEISYEDFINGLKILPSKEDNKYIISGLIPDLSGDKTCQVSLDDIKNNVQVINKNGLQNLSNIGVSPFKVILLDAGRRLQIANKTNSIKTEEPSKTPMQELYRNADVMGDLEEAFKRAFDMEIELDYSSLAEIKFRVSKEFETIPENLSKAQPIFEKYLLLDDQGDGFKSFVGIVLGVVLTKGRIVLIDEPEAFLHPAQARVLGEWLAKFSKKEGRQIIVATHSADILDGLLQGNSKATIMRVNRKQNDTEYHRIPSEITKQMSEMPLMSSQPVLDSIFYKGVIINEGDTDRVIYRSVYSSMFEKREHLFVDAFGKQAIKKIIKPLKDAKIDVCTIVDLDVLNSESDFKGLLDSVDDSDHDELLKLRKEIADAVEGIDEDTLCNNIKKDIKTLSTEVESISDIAEIRRKIGNIRQKSSKWKDVKEKGIEGLPNEVQNKAKNLLRELKKIGIFLPPVGELESWIEVENGPWIIEATRKIKDGAIPENLKSFVKEVIEYFDRSP